MAIKNFWPLRTFAKERGRLRLAPLQDKTTGEHFTACVFGEEGNLCFVAFSSKLGELNGAQIKAQADDLQVVERDRADGKEGTVFTLCKKGENSWEDVDL